MTAGHEITAIGSLVLPTPSNKLLSFSVNPVANGDVWMLAASVRRSSSSATTAVASIAGGGVAVGAWVMVAGPLNASAATHNEIWMGPISDINAANKGTITITLSGTAQNTTGNNAYLCQEFTSGGGPGTVWARDGAAGSKTNASSTTITYPTLTPTELNRLYFGYSWVEQSGTGAGTTAGYSVFLDSASNPLVFDENVPVSAQAPTTGQSPAGASAAIAALIYATNPVRGAGFFPYAAPGHHDDELAERRRLHVPHRRGRTLLRAA